MAIYVLCGKCKGKGFLALSVLGITWKKKCKTCDGVGKIQESSYRL